MKKTFFIFCIAMSLFAVSVFAQEVRGVETRVAVYYGVEYEYGDQSYDGFKPQGRSNEYYGFEFKNRNSISVSVTIKIYKDDGRSLVSQKEVVLGPNESYIMKKPEIKKYNTRSYQGDINLGQATAENGRKLAQSYIMEYKAFKLQ